jgi:hypothetical protein
MMATRPTLRTIVHANQHREWISKGSVNVKLTLHLDWRTTIENVVLSFAVIKPVKESA